MNTSYRVCDKVKEGSKTRNNKKCIPCFDEQKKRFKVDKIKEHTVKKVELVANYTKKWIEAGLYSSNNIEELNFIDAMSNSSQYNYFNENVETTAIRVFRLFQEYSKRDNKKDIKFNLYINDISQKRIDDIKTAIDKLSSNEKKVKVYFCVFDVNCFFKVYLQDYHRHSGSLTLLYVDPYNYATVDNNELINFLNSTYSELIFNYMEMDVRRNSSNFFNKEKVDKINNSIKNLDNNHLKDIQNINVLDTILKSFENTKFKKFNIPYEFKTNTNVTIYYLIFFAHHDRGLILYKDSIWEVFKGAPYFQNKSKKISKNQLTLDSFIDNFDESSFLDIYVEDSIKKLRNNYPEEFTCNSEFIEFIILETKLKKSHIINKLIKPLIINCILEKKDKKSRKYDGETFFWRDRNE